MAMDWWNAYRTSFIDADLNGLIPGYSQQTSPEEIYRALTEALTSGTRLIIELLKDKGVPVNNIRAGVGLKENGLLLQICIDVLGLPIEFTASE